MAKRSTTVTGAKMRRLLAQQGGLCALCRLPILDTHRRDVDHWIAWIYWPDERKKEADSDYNLRVLHTKCHILKKTRVVTSKLFDEAAAVDYESHIAIGGDCVTCGQPILGRNKGARYCRECWHERYKEHVRISNAKLRANYTVEKHEAEKARCRKYCADSYATPIGKAKEDDKTRRKQELVVYLRNVCGRKINVDTLKMKDVSDIEFEQFLVAHPHWRGKWKPRRRGNK